MVDTNIKKNRIWWSTRLQEAYLILTYDMCQNRFYVKDHKIIFARKNIYLKSI